ncbi:MAG: ribonuclease HI family protein [Bacillota bacterium]
MEVKVYTDGASRGNPGHAGIGIIILDADGHVLAEECDYIGQSTNNIAEYTAVIRGLKRAKVLGARSVNLFADSQLLVRQLTGQYKVKNEGLKPLYEQVRKLIDAFKSFNAIHIPREENKAADRLANKALDEFIKFSR